MPSLPAGGPQPSKKGFHMAININWSWPGWTWLKSTAEVVLVTFGLTLYSAWQDSTSPDITEVNWAAALRHGSYYAVGVVLYAVVGLKISNNGAWSWLKNVVARDKVEQPATDGAKPARDATAGSE